MALRVAARLNLDFRKVTERLKHPNNTKVTQAEAKKLGMEMLSMFKGLVRNAPADNTEGTLEWRERRQQPGYSGSGRSWYDTGMLADFGLRSFARKMTTGITVGVEPSPDLHPLWAFRKKPLSYADIFQIVHEGSAERRTRGGQPNPLRARPIMDTLEDTLAGKGSNYPILEGLAEGVAERLRKHLR